MNAHSDSIDIAIIGSGFAGLCMAIKLKEAGLTDFFIAEQAETLGGTWRDNHYPGCACDVQSQVYSFSFALNPDWTRQFAAQPEIRAYLEHCATRFELAPYLRFGMGLHRAVFDEHRQRWHLTFSNGRQVSARVLVSGMGGLSRPAMPDIPGLDSFKGKRFHSQQWDHDYSLKGKRVALNKGSDVNYLLVSALENAGLKYKDVTPVYLPPSDARAAFQRGAVDAWVIWDPYLAEVETHEKARLVKNAEGLVPHYTFYLASRKFADTYPQTAEKVVDELKQLSDWANKNPDGAADILSTSTGLDKAIWAKAVARMPFGAERMTPEVFKEQQALADKFSEIGLLPVKVNVSSATWSLDKK